jgi:hypothetical protein
MEGVTEPARRLAAWLAIPGSLGDSAMALDVRRGWISQSSQHANSLRLTNPKIGL